MVFYIYGALPCTGKSLSLYNRQEVDGCSIYGEWSRRGHSLMAEIFSFEVEALGDFVNIIFSDDGLRLLIAKGSSRRCCATTCLILCFSYLIYNAT